jgi:hypothetical protein
VEPEQGASTGEWVTVDDAARRLQVASATVRRRLKRGQLVGRQVSRPYGFDWQVWLDGVDTSVETDAAPSTPSADSELAQLLQHLADQNVQLAGRVGWLESQLQQAQARVLELEAPAANDTAPNVVEPAARQGWWQRLWSLGSRAVPAS